MGLGAEAWEGVVVVDLCVDVVVAGFLCVWGALAELRADLAVKTETNSNGLAAVLAPVEYDRECDGALPTHQNEGRVDDFHYDFYTSVLSFGIT